MGARTPEDLDRLFAAALNAGDLEALIRLYEPRAALRPAPDKIVQGHAAIRDALTGLLQMKPTIELTPKVLGQCSDIALVSARWTLNGTGADGKPAQMTGSSIEVARRQADGTWLFAIDTPWGLESAA
jgi:ketosteroid isomerase-like protein